MVESEDPEGGAYVRFLAVTGLRKTGALTLRWRDIDFNRGTMLVLQKGGICKSIPMTPEAILALQGRIGSAHPYPLDVNAMNRLKQRILGRFTHSFGNGKNAGGGLRGLSKRKAFPIHPFASH